MADEQNFDDDIDIEDSVSETSKKKGSFLSPFLVRILMIVALVVAMIIIAVVVSAIVFKVVGSRSPQVRPDSWMDDQIVKTKTIHYEYLELEDPFRQQLMDGKMIQLKITLAYKAKDKALQQELSQIKPEIRDIIIKHLSHLKSEDFVDAKSGGSALEKLEMDFLKQINRILNTGRVERILFQEYTLM